MPKVPKMPQPLTAPSNPITLQVLGVGETAAMLGVPVSTVYEMLRFRTSGRGNIIPHRRIGRYVKFLKHEVEDWLLQTPLETRTSKRGYRRKMVVRR